MSKYLIYTTAEAFDHARYVYKTIKSDGWKRWERDILMCGDCIAITWRNELPLARASSPPTRHLSMYETVFRNSIHFSDDLCTP